MIHKRNTALELSVKIFYWRIFTGGLKPVSRRANIKYRREAYSLVNLKKIVNRYKREGYKNKSIHHAILYIPSYKTNYIFNGFLFNLGGGDMVGN